MSKVCMLGCFGNIGSAFSNFNPSLYYSADYLPIRDVRRIPISKEICSAVNCVSSPLNVRAKGVNVL